MNGDGVNGDEANLRVALEAIMSRWRRLSYLVRQEDLECIDSVYARIPEVLNIELSGPFIIDDQELQLREISKVLGSYNLPPHYHVQFLDSITGGKVDLWPTFGLVVTPQAKADDAFIERVREKTRIMFGGKDG